VRITNVNGQEARVQYVDPMSGASLPVDVIERSDNSLTVSLPVVDYPRLLRIQE
jgi:hypothetical protein